MTQSQLERELCRATGETRQVIAKMGFRLVPMPRPVRAIPKHLNSSRIRAPRR